MVKDFPLKAATPARWAKQAIGDTVKLLNDHAHLEKKAAQNALDLLLCWPRHNPKGKWIRVLNAIAKDEVSHLAQVTRLLEKRGGALTRAHRSGYANALRMLVRRGKGPHETLDRLLVSGLIEARSAERFELLGKVIPEPDLAKLYRGLWASEQGHYKIFVELAKEEFEAENVEDRWEQLCSEEAKIIKQQAPGAVLHGWCQE